MILSYLKILLPILIKPLIVTIVVEELCLIILREKDYRIYLACLGMNLVTNVSMNIALQYITNYYLMLTIFEVLVFLIEAMIYYAFKKDLNKALLISFICNIASLIVGIFI